MANGCKKEEQVKSFRNSDKEEYRHFNIQVGEVFIQAEIAATPEEREKGLMYRDSLEPGNGMLFIFEKSAKRRFWMKNTRIPLDIGYFSTGGALLEVHNAQPFDQVGVPSRSNDVKFVLELNQGAFRKLGVRIGDRIILEEITAILLARGLNPQTYGLLVENPKD